MPMAVRTTDPERTFAVRLIADGVKVAEGEGGGGLEPDLALATEAFCRLVYGRLDPKHTPNFTGDGSVLDTLRAVFPGR